MSGDHSRTSGTSFKDVREIIQGCPRGHSRMSERSFIDLRRSFKDVRGIIQGCPGDHSRMSGGSFKDV
jgi:hypothetical protein